MTKSERNLGLERIVTLKRRNDEIDSLINYYEPSTDMEEMLLEIVKENETAIEQLTNATNKRYEFLFNFESGGWNSEHAFYLEQAIEQAIEKYGIPGTGTSLQIDKKSFRVSTPSDYQNLLSMFN